MKAEWVEGHQHPSGGRDDVYENKNKTVTMEFSASDDEEARLRVVDLAKKFQATLPKKKIGSLSWQDEDSTITSKVLSRVLEL